MTSVPPVSRAVVLSDFGEAAKLHIREAQTPKLARPDEVLVRVFATSVNPIEWKMRRGLGLPKRLWRLLLGQPMVLGLDFSGEVVARGPTATFEVGDEVMGAMPLRGAYAEYLVVPTSNQRYALARKPKHIAHEEAALVPFAGLVAHAGLVSHGGLPRRAPKARILIVGASGGVGHLAVQMAKYGLGAERVVAISSARNLDFARACGADEAIAYDQMSLDEMVEHHSQWHNSFDLIFDTIGVDAYWTRLAPRLLRRSGRFVSAALPPSAPGKPGEDVDLVEALALLSRIARRRLTGRYRIIAGLLGDLPTRTGFPEIVRWLEEGKVRPKTAASFDISRITDAHLLSETGRAVGKISVTICSACRGLGSSPEQQSLASGRTCSARAVPHRTDRDHSLTG